MDASPEKLPRICSNPDCATKFVPERNYGQKYCGPACARTMQRRQYAEQKAYRSKCPHCGLAIPPKSGKTRNRTNKGV